MATASRLQHALRLAEAGFRVLPSDPETKTPALWRVGEDKEWKRWQTEDTAPRLRAWFKDRPTLEMCAITGAASGWIVLDIDSLLARDYWVELLGQDVLDSVPHARSPKARELGDHIGHFYFPYPAGATKVKNAGHHLDGFEWDIRGDGGIVKVPPSFGYNWVRAPWDVDRDALETPPSLLKPPQGAYPGKKVVSGDEDGNVRSMMAHTMASLGEGGRNNDVTKLAGHLAKAFRVREMYDVQMELIWEKISRDGDGSYTRTEFDKTKESIWTAERSKPQAELDETNGWLAGTGDELRAQTRVKIDEEWVVGLEHWANFDLEAIGVVTAPDEERVYSVRLTPTGKEPLEALLSSKDLADNRRLTAWLAQYGCGVLPPDTIWPRSGTPGERLRRYVDAQDPPAFKVAQHLGWHDPDGFITHEGRITADGPHPFLNVRPHPNLLKSGTAPYRYGFDAGWQDVLREVLTFHDDTVCSVYGSWVMALLLRPQIRKVVSQFPFMAIQAPSGSGKSTGFFPLMVQLAGNHAGHITPTKASLRDYMASNQSGIVWIDDLDDPEYITELLRSSTVEGVVTKKGEDNTTQVGAQLVSGVVLSGEELGLSTQKALLDRAIMLTAPDPKSRKSQKPGREDVRQWEDVVALRERTGDDLTRYAGSIVQAALSHADMVSQIARLTPVNGGRWADKMAVVRLGARVLSELTGDPEHVTRVDAWVDQQVDTGDENALTLQLLPAALSYTVRTERPVVISDFGGTQIVSPVVVKDGEVWFSPEHLAKWWETSQRGNVEKRVATKEVLIEQAKAMGLGGAKHIDRKPMRVGNNENHRVYYWRCYPALSEALLSRSNGAGVATGDSKEDAGTQEALFEAPRLARVGWTERPTNLPPEDSEDFEEPS